MSRVPPAADVAVAVGWPLGEQPIATDG